VCSFVKAVVALRSSILIVSTSASMSARASRLLCRSRQHKRKRPRLDALAKRLQEETAARRASYKVPVLVCKADLLHHLTLSLDGVTYKMVLPATL
jgi:hypothetical protein